MSACSSGTFPYGSRSPETPVAVGPGGKVTWAEFCREVAALRDDIWGRSPREWVLCLGDSYHFAVAFCAVLAAGRAILLPGNAQPGAIAALADSRRGALYDGEQTPPFADVLSLPFGTGAATASAFDLADMETPRITLLTSGSTGGPKPVCKSPANLLTEVAALEAAWGDQLAGVQIVSTVSHQHIYGLLFRVLWPLCVGRLFDRHTLLYPEEVIARAREDVALVASPAILKRITEKAAGAYRMIFSSGGALSFASASDSSCHLGCRPTEIFGSTETGGIGWREQTAPDTPWTLFPGVHAEVGADHALQVSTPYTSPPSRLATGDAAHLVDARRFVWLGRVDSIVKIEEKRVSLIEVETRLTELDWIEEAAVVPLGPEDQTILAAVLVLTPSGRAALEQQGAGRFRIQVRRALRPWLEPAAVPRRYREVDALPVNAQGKRVRSELQALFGAVTKKRLENIRSLTDNKRMNTDWHTGAMNRHERS